MTTSSTTSSTTGRRNDGSDTPRLVVGVRLAGWPMSNPIRCGGCDRPVGLCGCFERLSNERAAPQPVTGSDKDR